MNCDDEYIDGYDDKYDDDDYDELYHHYSKGPLPFDEKSLKDNMPKNQIHLTEMIDFRIECQMNNKNIPSEINVILIAQAVSNLRKKGVSNVFLADIEKEVDMMLMDRELEKLYKVDIIDISWDDKGCAYFGVSKPFEGSWKYIKN